MGEVQNKSNLTEYIEQAIKNVKAALSHQEEIAGQITLEISVITESKGGVGVFIQVLNVGTSVRAEQVHKITIPIKVLTEEEKAKKIIELNKLWSSKEYKESIMAYTKKTHE